MPSTLAFDIGTKRTGVAFADPESEVPVALTSLLHNTDEKLVEQIVTLAKEKRAQQLVIGNPLLPSGVSGSQAAFVENIAQMLREKGYRVHLVDERYTTPRQHDGDKNAAAACDILGVFLAQRG